MTSIYASDLAAMFGDPVVAWLFGHTVRPRSSSSLYSSYLHTCVVAVC
jgi:hypothetical protein